MIRTMPMFPLQDKAIGLLKSHLKTLEDAQKNVDVHIADDYLNGLRRAIEILEESMPVIKWKDEMR